MPGRWAAAGLPDFSGRVRFRRRFGFPGRLESHDRVWLTFGGANQVADVHLNGILLGRHVGDEPFEFDATRLLQVRNELLVELEGPAETGGLWGEVALEVRCTAYLRGLRLETITKAVGAVLRATGEVVGFAELPLDLYLLCDGRNLAYTTVTAKPEGQPFHLDSEPLQWLESEPHHVQIDLVNGTSVWYRHEQSFR